MIGASTVVINHAYPLLNGKVNHDWMEKLTGCLGTGTFVLDMFFVISGYLITQSLLTKNDAADFFISRCKRIFPALITSVFLCVFVVGPIATKLSIAQYFADSSTWFYFINISIFKLRFVLPGVFTESYFHQNSLNGSIWTLAYEWVMYFLIFIFGAIGLLKSNKKFLFIQGIIVAAFIFLDAHPSLTTIKFFSIESSRVVNLYPYFFAGSLLFIFRNEFTIKWYYFAVATCIWIVSFHSSLASVTTFLFIPIFTIWVAFLPLPFLQKITASGDYSYGIYVYSFPIQQLIIYYSKATIGLELMLIISFVFTLPMAILSYHFIELPVLKKKYQNGKF